MKTRELGKTGIKISVVGFGTWAAGGSGWKASWGPQDDNETIAAVRRALELGVDWIDTAAVYGFGHSEDVVAKALDGVKNKPFIATKCGRRPMPDGSIASDLTSAFVRQDCENSLRRLKVSYIDLYQIHWPLPDEGIEEGWAEISKLVKEGKVRHAGVSNFSLAQLKRVQPIHPVVSLQPPYSMLNRDIEKELLTYCKEQGIGVLAYSPMQNGLLTGAFSKERLAGLAPDDFRRNNQRFQEPQFSATLELVEALKPVAKRLELTTGQLSIAWTLRRTELTSAIVGVRKPSQIEETYKAGLVELPVAAIVEIDMLLAAYQKKVDTASLAPKPFK
jgi:aryl-alcohol dehydrogenase-like predicted oxidoreductase